MKYFLVTKKNGTFGVLVSTMLKTKQWRDTKHERMRGLLLITVRCDFNHDNVFYTKSYEFTSGRELYSYVKMFKDHIAYRYGVDHNKGIIELDIVKSN